MSKQQITTRSGASPIGAYSQGLRVGDFVFVSGQGPVDPATDQMSFGTIEHETRRVFLNLKTILESAGATFEDVVQVRVFLKNISPYPAREFTPS